MSATGIYREDVKGKKNEVRRKKNAEGKGRGE